MGGKRDGVKSGDLGSNSGIRSLGSGTFPSFIPDENQNQNYNQNPYQAQNHGLGLNRGYQYHSTQDPMHTTRINAMHTAVAANGNGNGIGGNIGNSGGGGGAVRSIDGTGPAVLLYLQLLTGRRYCLIYDTVLLLSSFTYNYLILHDVMWCDVTVMRHWNDDKYDSIFRSHFTPRSRHLTLSLSFYLFHHYLMIIHHLFFLFRI